MHRFCAGHLFNDLLSCSCGLRPGCVTVTSGPPTQRASS